MAKATFNGQVVAQSDHTVIVEGNHYFPPDSIDKQYFSEHDRTTVCPWKGTASYYTVSVDGQHAEAAAWYYPEPKAKADNIRDHVAFYPAVKVEA
jgi:uncharacterized protein (DUF427 family)